MKTILKYIRPVKDDVEIQMPKNARILRFGMQAEQLCVWALVDTKAELEARHFKIVGTEQPLPADIDVFCCSDTVFDRHFVWHIFEEDNSNIRKWNERWPCH